MPCASSCSAQVTISSTERLWPRWITSQPRRLQDAAHDVDRRVVAVEQARRGDEADLVRRLVDERLLGDGDVVHRGLRVEPGGWRARRCGNPAAPADRGKLTPRRRSLPTLHDVYVNVNQDHGKPARPRSGNAFRQRGPDAAVTTPARRDAIQAASAGRYTQPPALPAATGIAHDYPRHASLRPPPVRRRSCSLLCREPPPRRCRPASRRARRSKASPNTRSPTACAVLLFPDASQPKTTVNVTYLVGSRMENYGETGMAHLLEHMMFKGTPTRGNLMTGARPARHALQRHDLVRPHQLFRDLHRVRREPRLGAGDGSRPHGQLVRRAQGPRHRDDGRAQRDGAQREQRRAHADPAHDWRRPTTGTTTARTRSARAPTSSTSTSAGCRRSIASTTSPTTRC